MTNHGARDAEVVLSLKVDGELVASAYHEVAAGADLPLVVDALPSGFRQIEASLTIPVASQIPDHLALDNRAWALVEGGAASRVLLFSPGNRFVEEVLRSLPGVEAFRGDLSAGLPLDPYDLTILDRWQPEQLPPGDLLFINPQRGNALFTLGEQREFARDIGLAPGDARTRFVDLDDVSVQRWTPVVAPWAQTLIEADGSPLLLAGEVGGRQVAIFTFDLHRSDLVLQIAWPVLMANLLDWFAPPGLLTARESLSVGETLQLRPPPGAEALRVRLPDGSLQDLSLERRPLLFADTQQPGIYTLEVIEDGRGLAQPVLRRQPLRRRRERHPAARNALLRPVRRGARRARGAGSAGVLAPGGAAGAAGVAAGMGRLPASPRRAGAASAPLMSLATPQALWLLLLLPPLVWLGWPRQRFRRARDATSLALRVLLLLCLVLALSGARVSRSSDRLAVVFLVDVSDSLGPELQDEQLAWVDAAMATMGPDDLAGIVAFGARPFTERAPGALREPGTLQSQPASGNTDLAAAIRHGSALLPGDRGAASGHPERRPRHAGRRAGGGAPGGGGRHRNQPRGLRPFARAGGAAHRAGRAGGGQRGPALRRHPVDRGGRGDRRRAQRAGQRRTAAARDAATARGQQTTTR